MLEELPHVAEQLRVDLQDSRGSEEIRRLLSKIEGARQGDSLDPSKVRSIMAHYCVGSQRQVDEIGNDRLSLLATQAVAVSISALRREAASFRMLGSTLTTLRLPALATYVLIRNSAIGSRGAFGFNLMAFAVGTTIVATLRDRLRALQAMETLVEAAPDRQISLTDPDARAMATNGKGTGLVGYNVQAAVDTKHHLVVTHEVTNVGHDRTQLANIAGQAQSAIDQETLQVLADRGYFSGEEILACDRAGIAVTLPKPMTSGAKAEGRFGKQDFVYQASDDTYRCPGDQALTYRFEGVENGMTLRRYWTSACPACPIKNLCTPAEQRRVTRWEHEHVLEAVQRRLDENPNAMRDRRQTVEHVFGTLKAWMGATHFLTRGLKNVASEMSLQVLAYNMKRVIAILGAGPLIAAIRG